MLAVNKVDVSKPGLMLLNNGIGVLLLAVLAAVVDVGEYGRTWAALTRPADAAVVVGSSVIGCGISYTAIWLQSQSTATSFMVVGAWCKALLVLAGVLFWHDSSEPIAILGASASLLDALSQQSQEPPKKGQQKGDASEAARPARKCWTAASQVHALTWGLIFASAGLAVLRPPGLGAHDMSAARPLPPPPPPPPPSPLLEAAARTDVEITGAVPAGAVSPASAAPPDDAYDSESTVAACLHSLQ